MTLEYTVSGDKERFTLPLVAGGEFSVPEDFARELFGGALVAGETETFLPYGGSYELKLLTVELVPAQIEDGDERPLVHSERESAHVSVGGHAVNVFDPYLIDRTITFDDAGEFISVKIGGHLRRALDAEQWEIVRSNFTFDCVYDPDSALVSGVDPCDTHGTS